MTAAELAACIWFTAGAASGALAAGAAYFVNRVLPGMRARRAVPPHRKQAL